jgi:hypothetical protein
MNEKECLKQPGFGYMANIPQTFRNNPYVRTSVSCPKASKYMSLEFISPTSNKVERLSSFASRIYCDNRNSLNNFTLEEIIFLNQNKDLWNADTLGKILE